VFVLDNEGDITERRVEIGLDDNDMVRLAGGLTEGELVLRTPPLKPGALGPASRLAAIRGTDGNDVTHQINERLKAVNEAVPVTPRTRAGSEGLQRER